MAALAVRTGIARLLIVAALLVVGAIAAPIADHLIITPGEHAEAVPSWLLSDGTLRLMALSLLAYSEREDRSGVYLIEEPENGLHPLAIQSVFAALSSMRTMQVFVATHSPVFLANTALDQALVFSRSDHGTARVLRGREVAELKEWQEQVQLADVFSTGVLSWKASLPS